MKGRHGGPLLFCLAALSSSAVFAQSPQAASKVTRSASAQNQRITLSDLLRHGMPFGLIKFDVPTPPGSSELSSSRLAVLDIHHGLRLFRIDGSNLTEEFAWHPLKGDEIFWTTLEPFPSLELPGVIVWSNAEQSYGEGIVVCYVARKPQIVYRGYGFDLSDLDGDGIPEILQYSPYHYDPKFAMVLTWNGERFVEVKRMAIADLYAKDIVAVIQAAKRQSPKK